MSSTTYFLCTLFQEKILVSVTDYSQYQFLILISPKIDKRQFQEWKVDKPFQKFCTSKRKTTLSFQRPILQSDLSISGQKNI